MTNVNLNKPVYIPSIEAEEIYDMSVRSLENVMKFEYKGMIPFSLELIKLRSLDHYSEVDVLKNRRKKKLEDGQPEKVKFQSDAIINIKFKHKIKDGREFASFVRGYDHTIDRLNAQLKGAKKGIETKEDAIKESKNAREKDKLEKSLSYLENKAKLLEEHIERIENDRGNPIYEEMKASELRQHLYINGFTFKGRHYRFYKRTASKSRQSQSLFILDELYSSMKEWSHMGLDLTGKVDVGSLLAYESLVSSSLEDCITIDPKNIFIINDRRSVFEHEAIEVGNNLEAVPNEKAKVSNTIWDGQGLADKSLFEQVKREDKGMMLLRQHFFKACVFNTNIQTFLEHNCPKHIPFDEWTLTDAFENVVAAKDILLITTPSALKYLKYYGEDKDSRKQAYANWCERVNANQNLFGICKSEKPTKYIDRSYTSYQMINTLDADIDDIKKLAEFEVDYIKSLQGVKDENGEFDDEPFLDYLEKKKDVTNACEMLLEIARINPEVVRTQFFRDYRKKQVHNYKNKVRGGKLRLLSQYCTVVSNPYEMLLAVVGKFPDVVSHSLGSDEIYTTLYDFDQTYTLVRNPHNAMNGFYKAKNVHYQVFEDYFKFTKNICVINSCETVILDSLNGMDMDSDQILIFSDKSFNDIVDKTLTNRKYPVILNKTESGVDPVELTNKNCAVTDEKTAKSQSWIGEITNACQYQVSVLWEIQNSEEDTRQKQEKIDQILKNISVLVVLSNLAIDYSKKVVNIKIGGALSKLRASKALKVPEGKNKLVARKKPNFWQYVSSSRSERESFNCPMDLLGDYIESMGKATYRENLPMNQILTIMTKDELKGADDQQIEDIVELVVGFDKNIGQINADDSDKKSGERQILIENMQEELDEKIAKKKIKKATMYKILTLIALKYDKAHVKKSYKVSKDLHTVVVPLMNTLYRTHGQTFLNLFKK